MSKVVHGIYLLLGANLGDPPQTFQKVRQMMLPSISISRVSELYITAPWKMSSENLFFNQVLEIETELGPEELLSTILSIEKDIGRQRGGGEGYEDRLIDIDILLYRDLILASEDLNIPQKDLEVRAFALKPLLDINPDLIDPRTQLPFIGYMKALSDSIAQIKKYK